MEKKLKRFHVIGHSPYTDEWMTLGFIWSVSERGANLKAHRLHGLDFYEFAIVEVGE